MAGDIDFLTELKTALEKLNLVKDESAISPADPPRHQGTQLIDTTKGKFTRCDSTSCEKMFTREIANISRQGSNSSNKKTLPRNGSLQHDRSRLPPDLVQAKPSLLAQVKILSRAEEKLRAKTGNHGNQPLRTARSDSCSMTRCSSTDTILTATTNGLEDGQCQPRAAGYEESGAPLSRDDLYHELNHVLQRRKELGEASVAALENSRSGKSVMYYGGGAKCEDAEEVRSCLVTPQCSPRLTADTGASISRTSRGGEVLVTPGLPPTHRYLRAAHSRESTLEFPRVTNGAVQDDMYDADPMEAEMWFQEECDTEPPLPRGVSPYPDPSRTAPARPNTRTTSPCIRASPPTVLPLHSRQSTEKYPPDPRIVSPGQRSVARLLASAEFNKRVRPHGSPLPQRKLSLCTGVSVVDTSVPEGKTCVPPAPPPPPPLPKPPKPPPPSHIRRASSATSQASQPRKVHVHEKIVSLQQKVASSLVLPQSSSSGTPPALPDPVIPDPVVPDPVVHDPVIPDPVHDTVDKDTEPTPTPPPRHKRGSLYSVLYGQQADTDRGSPALKEPIGITIPDTTHKARPRPLSAPHPSPCRLPRTVLPDYTPPPARPPRSRHHHTLPADTHAEAVHPGSLVSKLMEKVRSQVTVAEEKEGICKYEKLMSTSSDVSSALSDTGNSMCSEDMKSVSMLKVHLEQKLMQGQVSPAESGGQSVDLNSVTSYTSTSCQNSTATTMDDYVSVDNDDVSNRTSSMYGSKVHMENKAVPHYEKHVPASEGRKLRLVERETSIESVREEGSSGSSTPRASAADQEVIANLMITHSGDRIPPEGAESDVYPHGPGYSRIATSHVTVPEPTSFHQHGNDVGKHLITGSESWASIQQLGGKSQHRFRKEYRRKSKSRDFLDDKIDYSTFECNNSSKSNPSILQHNAKNRAKKKHKCMHYYSWNSTIAKRMKSQCECEGGFGGRGTESDSTITLQSERSGGRGREEGQGGEEEADPPRPPSRAYVLREHEHHSSDGDTESLYQELDEYERSLIHYVRTDNLSQMNEDIKSMYRQQLDVRNLAAVPAGENTLLHRLACCFMCRSHNSSASAPVSATGLLKARQQHVYKSCPIRQEIVDSGSATAYGDGLTRGEEDKSATFWVDSGGRQGDLDVTVDGPNSIAKCHVEPDTSGKYLVTYIPVEVGTYNVRIRWNGRDIAGSPFRPRIVDTRKVRVTGGWESIVDANNRMLLKVNEAKYIEFDTRDAGPGKMTAEIRGPEGHVHCEVIDRGGSHVVTFTPRVEGEYYIKVFWSEVLLPRCPIIGVVKDGALIGLATGVINHEKVVLTGHGLREARVREEAEFVIDGTDAGPGVPDVKLSGVKTDIEVRCVSIGGNKYRCSYSPQIAGAYLLNIMWSDRQVRGSPFKVNVTASSDASKVLVAGEGIKSGVMGRDIKSTIDTRRAGPGELTAHCMGPNKVAYCELYDHRDGTFTLNVKPQEPGKHVLQIKYGGEHVPGSPFMLRISGAPDASKVRVSGPGIEHGILATYQSRFIVETRGAGAGQLTVRIRGPKGAFRVEMQRESQKDRTILCRYDPTEVGDYIVHVKWSGEHVPGSPFHVQIFDTQQELEHFMAENPNRRTNAINMNTMQSNTSTRSWTEDF